MDKKKLEEYINSMDENRTQHLAQVESHKQQVEFHQRQVIAYEGALQFARQLLGEIDSEVPAELELVGQEI